MMTFDDFIAQIKRHEGFRDHVYCDTVGVLTGGWGHAFLEGSRIPLEVAEALLRHDLGAIDRDYTNLNLPIDPKDSVRRYVIKNMLFNIGLGRLLRFKKMLAAIRAGDYKKAADEMMDSKWARQVKGRAVELAEMMRTGEYDPNRWR